MTKRSALLDGVDDVRVLREKLKLLEQRVTNTEFKIEKGDINITQGDSALSNHAVTHATKKAKQGLQNSGKDPIDKYEFDWTRAHTFKPKSAGDIPVLIEVDQQTHTADAFRVSTVLSGSNSTEPSQINPPPVQWYRADDIAHADGELITNKWISRVTAGGLDFDSDPDVPPDDSPEPKLFKNVLNGHAVVRKIGGNATGTLELPAWIPLTNDWTVAFVYKTPGGVVPICGNLNDAPIGQDRGFQLPSAANDTQVSLVYNGGAVNPISVPFDNTGNDYNICIARRDENDDHYCNFNGREVTLATPYNDPYDPMRISGLFALDKNSIAPEGSEIAEMIFWDDYLTDEQVRNLFQYLNDFYGLGYGELDGFIVKPSGRCGIDSDPDTARLHIRDPTAAQLRLEFGASAYCDFQVDVDGNLTISCTGTGINWAPRRDVYANRGAASDHQGQFFIEDRQASTLGDRLWLSIQLSTASWDWLQIAKRDTG